MTAPTLLGSTCVTWVGTSACGSTDGVRPYLQGPTCTGHATPGDDSPGRLCPVCGRYLDPAAAAGPDGQPGVWDRHPGCEAGGQQLRLIKGGRR
ncbi:hypothetical protein [Micromonospora sp. NPDC001898]|uniref:hypothetical protein n=1 Tax=Micromonospora sp. NPDC001898 TaxID=3364221 RepID=UPI0036A8EEB8